MLMRILLCLIAIYACETHKFDGRVEEKAKDEADQEADCLKACDVACEDWGSWSALSPATDTACVGKKLTQSQKRTRSCKATCPDVKCSKTDIKEKEVDGTNDCTEPLATPPPPCQTSCNNVNYGCEEKNYTSDWSPAVETECKDKNFKQEREWTRVCPATCDDRKDCICSNVQCAKEGVESQFATGTRVTPCEAPHCTDWEAVSGDEGKWSPLAQNKPYGEKFEQSRKEKRTCSGLCPNSNCETTRTATQKVDGLRDCKQAYINAGENDSAQNALNQLCRGENGIWNIDKTGVIGNIVNCCEVVTPPVVTPPVVDPVVDPPVVTPPVVDPPEEQTCADKGVCGEWNEWKWKLTTDECPDPTSIEKPELEKEVATRTRTRICTYENEDLGCLTTNTETRMTKCEWCQGANQQLANGVCVEPPEIYPCPEDEEIVVTSGIRRERNRNVDSYNDTDTRNSCFCPSDKPKWKDDANPPACVVRNCDNMQTTAFDVNKNPAICKAIPGAIWNGDSTDLGDCCTVPSCDNVTCPSHKQKISNAGNVLDPSVANCCECKDSQPSGYSCVNGWESWNNNDDGGDCCSCGSSITYQAGGQTRCCATFVPNKDAFEGTNKCPIDRVTVSRNQKAATCTCRETCESLRTGTAPKYSCDSTRGNYLTANNSDTATPANFDTVCCDEPPPTCSSLGKSCESNSMVNKENFNTINATASNFFTNCCDDTCKSKWDKALSTPTTSSSSMIQEIIKLNKQCPKDPAKPMVWDGEKEIKADNPPTNCCIEAPHVDPVVTRPVIDPEESPTCADVCDEWPKWQEGQWEETTEKCSDPDSLTGPTSIVEATRTRTRTCDNAALGCITTNTEQRETECATAEMCTDYSGCPLNKKLIGNHANTARTAGGKSPLTNCCELKKCEEISPANRWCKAEDGYVWKDMNVDANAKALANNMTNASNCCECDSEKRWYKVANGCQQCPDDYDFKQVDGSWTCKQPECDDCCTVWAQQQSTSPQASDVCKDETFTPIYTENRNCDDCPSDKTCDEVKTTYGTKITGTKEIDCDKACDGYTYGQWSPQATASKICVGETVAQTTTETRLCPDDDCNVCETTRPATRTVNGTRTTPCRAPHCQDWEAVNGSNWSPLPKTKPLGERFEQSRQETRTCAGLCPNSNCDTTRTAKRFKDGTGTCKTEYERQREGGNQNAQNTLNQRCEKENSEKPIWDITITDEAFSVANCCKEAEAPETCGDVCGEWDESDWKWNLENNGYECPEDETSFDKPKYAEEKATRKRTRTCNNADLGCITTNSEKRITVCEWCQGEKQKLDGMGVCVCADGYYKYTYLDTVSCLECTSPKVVNADGDKCVCKQDLVDDCTDGKFNHNTCVCARTTTPATPQETKIPVNIYNSCFINNEQYPYFFLPHNPNDLGNVHEWRKECFDSDADDYTYGDVINVIHTNYSSDEKVTTAIIQKLYDCAKKEGGGQKAMNSKNKFKKQLTNNENRDCNFDTPNINVWITE